MQLALRPAAPSVRDLLVPTPSEPLMSDRHNPEEASSLYPTGLEEALRRALDAEKGNGEAVEPMPEKDVEEKDPP